MIMSQSDAITDNDLDFFLTIISMFCEYNHTMHYSDRVFADITDNPGRTKRIILKLAEEGYIKAVPQQGYPHFRQENHLLLGLRFIGRAC